jgi:methylsterol monooxygenase
MFNMTVVTLLFLFASYPWLSELPLHFQWKHDILALVMSYIWVSVHFYWVHRFLHHKVLYKRFHAYHHQWVIPDSWAAFDAHPLEHLICNLLPVFLGPMLFDMSLPCIRWWLHIATMNGIYAHCSDDENNFHQIHHRYPNRNYGISPGLMDWWQNTFLSF